MNKGKISNGPMCRTRACEKAYRHYRKKKTNDCDFCSFSLGQEQVIEEFDHFWHVKNIFGYELWDGHSVKEHTMVVPKRHVVSLSEFTPEEAKEYFGIIASLEKNGCAIFSRSDLQATKSVPHQHTHAIRQGDKEIKSLIYHRSPHVLKYR